jgi:hypothetical protein
MRAVRRNGGARAASTAGIGVTTVIGAGMAAVLAALCLAVLVLAATSPAVRRAAGTIATACGSSGTGAGTGIFGGEARRGKAGVPQ